MYQEPENHRRDVRTRTLGDRFRMQDTRRREGAFATLSDLKWGELKPEGTQDHRFALPPMAKEISRPYWFKPGFFEPNQFIDEVNRLPLFKEMNAQLLADIPHALGYFQENMFKNAPDSLMQQMWARVEKNWFVWSAERFEHNANPQDLCEASMGLQTLRASAPVQTKIPDEWRELMTTLFVEMLPVGSSQKKHRTVAKHVQSAHIPGKMRAVDAKNVNAPSHIRNLEQTQKTPMTLRPKMTLGQFFGIMDAWTQTPEMMTEYVRTQAFVYLTKELVKFGSPDGKPEFTSRELMRAIRLAADIGYTTPEFMSLWENAAEAELDNFTATERQSCMESLKKLGKEAFPEFESAWWEGMIDNLAKLDNEALIDIIGNAQNKGFAIPGKMLADCIVRFNGNVAGLKLPLTEDTFESVATRLQELDHEGLSRVLGLATESGHATRDFLKTWESAAAKHLTKFTPAEHLGNMACFRMENTKASAGLRKAYWTSVTDNLERLNHSRMTEVLRTAAEQGSAVPERLFPSYTRHMDFELPSMTREEAIRLLWDLAAVSVTTPLSEKALDLAHEVMPLAEMGEELSPELRQLRYEAFQRFFPAEVRARPELAVPDEKLSVPDVAASFYEALRPAEEEMGLGVTVENEDTHTFRIKGRFVCINIDNASNLVPDALGNPTTYSGRTLLQTALAASENPDGVVVRLSKDLAAMVAAADGHSAERLESFKREVVKLYPGAYLASYDGKRFDFEPMEIPQIPAWTPKGFQHPVDEMDMG